MRSEAHVISIYSMPWGSVHNYVWPACLQVGLIKINKCSVEYVHTQSKVTVSSIRQRVRKDVLLKKKRRKKNPF